MEINKNKNSITNIDAVLLWVDGNDTHYRSKIFPYLKQTNKNSEKRLNTRYEQINEIEYAVKSILKFAPYIRNIFIVTDNQTPSFLKQNNQTELFSKVSIIDHSTIFNELETYLPTFNSRTIESCIHRIPGLSEHFIYLNDDFFIINPTTEKDFFTSEGFPILRGNWEQFKRTEFINGNEKASHKKAQEKAAKLLGFKKFFRFKHTPHPLRKSTLHKFFEENNDILLNNIQYKFRNNNQFLPVSLAYHLEIKNGTCKIQNNLQLLYFRSYKKPLIWYKLKLKFLNRNKLFLCLQNLNKAPENKFNYITKWLNNII